MMMPLRWKAKVLNSEKNFIMAEVPRRSGKTTTAIEWAIKQTEEDKRVLYVTPTHRASRNIFDRLMATYGEDVNRAHRSSTFHISITFSWGGGIDFLSAGNFRGAEGRRMGALVFDEPGDIIGEVFEAALATVIENPNSRILSVGKGIENGGMAYGALKVLAGLMDKEDVEEVRTDYLDLVHSGLWSMEQVEKHMQGNVEEESEVLIELEASGGMKNQDFLVLLKK